jgi:hypothetical protein
MTPVSPSGAGKENHTCISVEGKETASPSRRLGIPGVKKNGKKYVAERHRTKKHETHLHTKTSSLH